LGYGKGYQYAHDSRDKLTNMQCLPDSLLGREYYHPTKQGFEERYGERLSEIKKWKAEHGAPGFDKWKRREKPSDPSDGDGSSCDDK
ncbi:MAG: hypothetical protein II689_04280, partial [Firmicutes bacterium]|nr:hypothetical protein [Bacillota bacterium]